MDKNVEKILKQMTVSGHWKIETECVQHGNVTVFEHSINVAQTSIMIAKILPVSVDEKSLIRGALLHDYFLYDWHDKTIRPRLHGLRHPHIALRNAKKDYDLNYIEDNIILRHMFPLTPVPPLYKEAWIVCFADKYCAVKETILGRLKNVFPAGV